MAEENCSYDCSSCEQKCDHEGAPDFSVPANPLSNVGKVVGVVSGKGGVGKSLVTALLACAMQRKGRQCGILDADVTGPSIPRMFGIDSLVTSNASGIIPAHSKRGIDVMSVNLLVEDKSTPVIWRGPAIASVVKQFWSDVIWSYEDFLFVDMPPGTGDVPLTVFQSLPVDGIVIVTSPQELVSMIVEKAMRMAKEMNVPILGIIENMSYVQCPECGKKIKLFGEGHAEETAKRYGIDFLGEIPLSPELARLCDAGNIEYFSDPFTDKAAAKLESLK
ncbi:Mrp/NBP35 family ATP-binding protein [Synergistes jonesii]|uniref:Iron-sulfur cluster carrier protein n=1 Tax=Synergistes jonesii TaxID=2754 RepID=A0A073ISV1_9BACT|nr:Mrp/NBP35 family ATP-binding protein [Synergistes jonesii]KEJ92889.1 ATP-binding protein [Synergistes jonesii]OFB64175.1 ATP-binding protein [Synergistes jonesii]OFB64648.1 ATP-binding protein [Synergistes jonesii]OFB65397.1 ATP-binding protein [Synergistes jonesii]OFB68437.1 ATP-binding protein [Synergistes jonesii]